MQDGTPEPGGLWGLGGGGGRETLSPVSPGDDPTHTPSVPASPSDDFFGGGLSHCHNCRLPFPRNNPRDRTEREGTKLAIGDLQAAGSNAYEDAIELEVDAYLKDRVIPRLIETARPELVEHCLTTIRYEQILRDIEAATMKDHQDYDHLYEQLLTACRDLLRQGLARASINFRVSMP